MATLLAGLTLAPVPAPLPLVEFLHGLTFVLHTAAMNVMVACAFALALAGPRHQVVLRRAASLLPPAISITVTLGVAPLLFLQLVHGERFYASSIQMAWPWLLGLAGLILGYYAAYACEGRLRAAQLPSRGLRVLPLLSMLVFSFILASNVALSEHPRTLAGMDSPGWHLALAATHAPLRWAHELVGAVALGSVVFLVLGARARDRDGAGTELMQWGVRVLLAGTALSVLLGVLQVVARPGAIGGAMSGAALTVGILSGLTTPWLAWRYLRRPGAALLAGVLATGLLTLSAKTVLRFSMRAHHLAAEGPVAPPDTTRAWGPFLLFAACLLLAVASLVWLLRMAGRAAATPHPTYDVPTGPPAPTDEGSA